jgi:hypothetical protein
MTRGHVAGRRRRFAPRRHSLDERGPAAEVRSISFKVPGIDPVAAIAVAKDQAREEGWTIRTLSSARPASDGGLWVVTFAAVRA